MNHSLEKEGVLAVVLERFEKQRLPRVLDIKKIIDEGGTLSNSDINFLDEVLSDTKQYAGFVEKHPEFRDMFARVSHLYNEITKKALENEKPTSSGAPLPNVE
ncbi:MAG: hypothetical protein ABFS39_19670 [Pseudomonadota bacterium]